MGRCSAEANSQHCSSLVHRLAVLEMFQVLAKTWLCMNVDFISCHALQSSSKAFQRALVLFVDQSSNVSLGWEAGCRLSGCLQGGRFKRMMKNNGSSVLMYGFRRREMFPVDVSGRSGICLLRWSFTEGRKRGLKVNVAGRCVM